jgi:hypothetical protein
MGNFIDRDDREIGFHSEFVGDSYLRARVRNYGRGSAKILIDVTELTGHRTSKARAVAMACKYAMQYGVVSMDYSMILDYQIDRKATQLDGSKTVVHIRSTCFAFAAVAG